VSLVTTEAISVSEYASRIGSALRAVGGAVLEGEVQEPRRSPGGLLFFGLTDGDSTLKCKMFRQDLARLEHQPKDGDLVRVVVDRPDFYVARGQLTVIVSKLEPTGGGVGAILNRLEDFGLVGPRVVESRKDASKSHLPQVLRAA
jgi:exonuclease VII large subunit